jgi:hypothetical protein
MADSVTVSTLQRVKISDGSYAIVLPINTTDEVLVDVQNNVNLTSALNTINVTITNNKDTVMDDLITIMTQLSSFITKPLDLNHISIRDMSSSNNINLTSGLFIPGKILI